jgi:hypothetical protein
LRGHGGGRLARRRHRYRRRHGLGLTARIGNRHGVRHIINDNRVVDVVVNHVVRRRRHVSGRTHPDGNRSVDRHRQHKKSHGRQWRCQHHKPRRWRRQENDRWWRRRREREYRIIKDENRPADIDDFFRRRRRQVIVYRRERRRRLERGGKKGQATVRIGRVRSLRISPQIRPIGRRRVDEASSPPRYRLAPRRHNGAHPRGHRIVRIGGEEFGIAVQRVALQGRGIGFLRGQFTHRPRTDRRSLFARNGRRRRIRRPLEKHE